MKTEKKFTLVELIVVVAIVAIIATIKMSMPSTAKEMVKNTKCNDNIRQLLYGYQTYASDNSGWLRPATLTTHSSSCWIFDIRNYIYKNAVSGGPTIVANMDKWACFYCPAEITNVEQCTYGHYVLNAYGLGTPDSQTGWTPPKYVARQENKLLDPSLVSVFFDSARIGYDENGKSKNHHSIDYVSSNYIGYKHHIAATPACTNVGFYDGHVQLLSKDKIGSNKNFLLEGISLINGK